jgi:hypothetical protein
MSNPRAPKLDESNSRLYRPRHAEPKHAFLRWRPASYELEWGKQEFDGPHMVIEDKGIEYGSELNAFFSTHAPIPEREDHYRKVACVRAARVDRDTDLVTVVDGREEATATVKAGGFIVQNPGGEQYYNTPEEFERRYEPAEPEG